MIHQFEQFWTAGQEGGTIFIGWWWPACRTSWAVPLSDWQADDDDDGDDEDEYDDDDENDDEDDGDMHEHFGQYLPLIG